MDANLKEKILKYDINSGCDMDGDIISYDGKMYYVNIFTSTVVER